MRHTRVAFQTLFSPKAAFSDAQGKVRLAQIRPSWPGVLLSFSVLHFISNRVVANA